VGEAAEPYKVGTTAQIVQVDRLNDGRLNIICVGNARFRIQQTYHDRPYLRGTVDLWPWQPFDTTSDQVPIEQVRSRLHRYIDLLAKLTQSDVKIDLPNDPATLANLAASVLQVAATEKQDLLITSSIGQLLEHISTILQRELRGLTIMQAARQPPPDESGPFSPN
jgi:Lon protease-like protein